METLGAELLIVSYIGVLLGVVAQLRWVAGADAGYLVMGSLLVVTKGGDIGAYFFGRLFGKRKMVPHLSPGKTWAGAVGALIGSAVSAVVWLQYATPQFTPRDSVKWIPPEWYYSACYGAILGVTGLIGDLCESLIKRDVGKKDSARLLPGFGGLLDLMDSVIYAGPVAYVLWKALPLVTWPVARTCILETIRHASAGQFEEGVRSFKVAFFAGWRITERKCVAPAKSSNFETT